MGRDKPKKYNKMGYFQKQAYHDEQAKKYNINKDDFNTAQGGGGGRYDNLDESAYKKAIKNAMRNDFDYRTSASHMDGVKGNAQMGDFTDYERAAVKLHKKAGNGGEYSSNKDITGVTNNLVKDYRDSIQDQIAAATGPASDDEQTDTSLTPDEPYEPSEELVKARAVAKEWEEGYGFGGTKSPFNDYTASADTSSSSSSSAPITTDVDAFAASMASRKNNKAGANSFVTDYMNDVKSQLAPQIS
jgi:hypothetical protein